MVHPVRLRLSTAAVLFLFVGLAAGQNSDQPPAAPLSGPKVKESKIPGVHETFGDKGNDPTRRKDARSVPPEVIKRALQALDRDDTPADARLTTDQSARIKSLVADFQASIDAYKRAHKAEMDEVRAVLGRDGAEPGRPKAKREGGPHPQPPSPPPPPAGGDNANRPDDPMQPHEGDTEQVAAARAKLAELRKNAPNSLDLQTQVWNVLTEPQHAIVQAEVEKFIKAREEDKARDFVRKRLDKKGGPGDRQAPGLKADGTIDLDKLPPKMKERLEKMTPAEREKALAKLRERIKKGENPDGRGKKPASGQGADKPPPRMDEVPVPPPEEPRDR
jgi:hypothetical protein